MKQCLALAGLVCLLATGCATTGGTAGHVTMSQRAPRPTILRDYRKPGPDSSVQLASFRDSCDAACDCGIDCGDACNGGCGACQQFINGIASGGCGPNGCGPGGLCPGGSYPQPNCFNQGPPVGQTAYPYYTVRGPRDFLRNNPPTIGPY
jgi:hypothetical protein